MTRRNISQTQHSRRPDPQKRSKTEAIRIDIKPSGEYDIVRLDKKLRNCEFRTPLHYIYSDTYQLK